MALKMTEKIEHNKLIEALKTVYDPEIPVDIYELGLIYGINEEINNNIKVTMTLTAPGCPVAEEIPKWVEHHSKLMSNYRKQNWDFCEQMIEHCQTRWGGELTSFYTEMYTRIQELKTQKLPKDWDGVLQR